MKYLILVSSIVFSNMLFAQSDTYIDTVCAGTTEFYKVIKEEGSTYHWAISKGGTAVYGVDTNSDSIRVEWTATETLSEEFVKVVEENKYGRMGDTVYLNVLNYPVPSAIISGSDTLFEDNTGSSKINIELTGTAPWVIDYNNGKEDLNIGKIETSPFMIETGTLLNPPEKHAFTLISVKDQSGCRGNVSGVAEIIVSPAVKTSEIFHR